MVRGYNKIKLSVVIFVLIIVISIVAIIYNNSKEATASTTVDPYLQFMNFDPNAELGSDQNPFIILEIVPYRGMGQIGYIVGGQEPVDPNISTPKNYISGDFIGYAKSAFEYATIKVDGINLDESWAYNWISDSLLGQNGYFTKVVDKTGLYDKKASGSTSTFVRNKEARGDYNWIQAENTNNIPTDYNSDTIWMANYKLDTSYWVNTGNWKIKNTEVFKRDVLLLNEDEIEDYHVRVVTITPDELNKNVEKFTKYYDLSNNGINNKKKVKALDNGEIDLIGNADLISISPKAHAGEGLIDFWEKNGRDLSGKSNTADRKTTGFSKTDLNWQTTLELFMKIGVVEDSAALIYDITCFDNPQIPSIPVTGMVSNASGNGFTNNVYKLILMLRQQDPVQFYNFYLNTNGGTSTPKVTITITDGGKDTGSYNIHTNSNAKIYWNEYTFLPALPDGTFPKDFTIQSYRDYLKQCRYIIGWISGQNHDAVIRNTYSYNGTQSIVQEFKTMYPLIENTDTIYPYNKALFDYLEKKSKLQNPNASRPNKATPCDAVEYILQVKPVKTNWKPQINILDLEPSNDVTLTEEIIRKLIPMYPGRINIEQQTTAEFIGKIEDLNSTYDLIFIGTKTGKMNTDDDGKTVYNDPMMDGLIYTHVGDRVVAYDTFSGILKNERGIVKAYDSIRLNNGKIKFPEKIFKGYENGKFHSKWKDMDFYRYPGNDITSIKKEELQQYIDAGYPILLENDLYNRSTEILDDSSYLYQLLNENKVNENIFNFKQIKDLSNQYDSIRDNLIYLISKEKLTVDLITVPISFDVDNEDTLLESRTLTYEFIINPPSESQEEDLYQWKLYVDANADGRFVDKERIASDRSEAGDLISITRNLPDKYAGVIPWRLEVFSIEDSNIRTEHIGYTAFKVHMNQTEKLKAQINVLQITSDSSTLNLQELLNPPLGKTSLFYKYTSNLDDFNVNITTINVSNFLNKYKGYGNAYDVNRPEETDKLFFIEKGEKKPYDMLIFGFGDCYSDINNDNGALYNIQAFIDSGKSVMFTHDTTSFVNQQSSSLYSDKGLTYWGYGFNQYLRNRVGMDRFGVMKDAGDTTPYDVATMPSEVEKDLIYERGVTTYPEIQGLTYGVLVAFSNPGSNGLQHIFDANYDYPPFSTGNNIVKGSAINKYHSNFVTKVNEGQITNYPYKIDDFPINTTHTQYYQLNMDDPEIVVWYSLSDSKSKDHPNNKNNDDYTFLDETGPYSTSPNDVRNNYYIYSKGNIMYTGVGHSTIDRLYTKGSEDETYVNEVKLFINTMIASYNAGVTAPKVEITNEDAIANGTSEYIMYEDLDNVIPTADAVKRIKFKAEDTNVLSEDLIARIYYYDTAGNLVLANPIVKSISGSTATTYSGAGMEAGYYIKNGREYYFELPLSTFYANGSDKVYITVTNEENAKGGIKGVLVGRSLFDLD
jgi:hypothetical protein